MSAVGLMLLEDPKARARAEARIRNGTAKRRSFFGRSSAAAAPPPGQARRVPNLPPTIPDEDGEDDSPIVRPSTSLSQTIALPGRKKTESTSDRSSSRNSTIFGRKNSLGESSIRSGSSGRASQLSGVASSYSRDQIGHEEECECPGSVSSGCIERTNKTYRSSANEKARSITTFPIAALEPPHQSGITAS